MTTNPTSELKWLQLPAGRNAQATISVGSNPEIIFLASLLRVGYYPIDVRTEMLDAVSRRRRDERTKSRNPDSVELAPPVEFADRTLGERPYFIPARILSTRLDRPERCILGTDHGREFRIDRLEYQQLRFARQMIESLDKVRVRIVEFDDEIFGTRGSCHRFARLILR